MIIKTEEGFNVDVNGSTKFEVLGEISVPVHWGWWVLWFLLFWPALLLVAIISFTRKAYIVKIDNAVWTLKKENYDKLVVAVHKNIK